MVWKLFFQELFFYSGFWQFMELSVMYYDVVSKQSSKSANLFDEFQGQKVSQI
jgi:hypothetical protein